MNIIPLIIALHKTFVFSDSLEAKIVELNRGKQSQRSHLYHTVSLQHNVIKLQMHLHQEGVKRSMLPLYVEALFSITDTVCSLTRFYCEDEAYTEALQNYLVEHVPKSFVAKQETPFPYSEETLKYLTLADEIAKQTYMYGAGDDYYPGYYSEIVIEETQIVLKQINNTNARSIDHKTDYYMRKLVFIIPTTAEVLQASFGDKFIGKMLVQFNDHSTANNKTGGNRIREKLDEVAALFE